MRFALRLVTSAAALWVATRVVPGVTYDGGWLPMLGVALVFGVVNAFIRPITQLLAFPIVILSLGLFLFVINGLMLWITSTLSDLLGLGFHVRGFWAGFWGAFVVSVVNGLLSLMLRADEQLNYRSIE